MPKRGGPVIEKFVEGGVKEKCPKSRLRVQPGTQTPAFSLEVYLNMKSLF